MARKMKYKHRHSAVGGTFDRLHKGHHSLLHSSFDASKLVTIGISSDEFASKRLKKNFEDYDLRFKELVDYLKNNNFLDRTKIIKLDDLFGSTLTDETLDSIVVTKDTIQGAGKINLERLRQGLPELKVHVVPLVLGSRKKAISSTDIREGVTDREGRDYFSHVGNIHFKLPDDKRPLLSQPQGQLIKEKDLKKINFSKYTKIILVGDIVTKTFIKHGFKFDLAIVDLKTKKRKLFKSLEDLGLSQISNLRTIKNKRGTISKMTTKAIRDAFSKNLSGSVIKVIGEEDLAVIPVVILAPLSSLVIYGQRDEGMVCIVVTEKTKEKFVKLLRYLNRD